MLHTPAAAARRPNCGQRGSLRRSSIRKTVCCRIASTLGPLFSSYWMPSISRARSPVAATVVKTPLRPWVIEAQPVPGTRLTAVREIATSASAGLSCADSSRPISPYSVASPAGDWWRAGNPRTGHDDEADESTGPGLYRYPPVRRRTGPL
jgi:hypothetical protein